MGRRGWIVLLEADIEGLTVSPVIKNVGLQIPVFPPLLLCNSFLLLITEKGFSYTFSGIHAHMHAASEASLSDQRIKRISIS